jgi:hypothetical protein
VCGRLPNLTLQTDRLTGRAERLGFIARHRRTLREPGVKQFQRPVSY